MDPRMSANLKKSGASANIKTVASANIANENNVLKSAIISEPNTVITQSREPLHQQAGAFNARPDLGNRQSLRRRTLLQEVEQSFHFKSTDDMISKFELEENGVYSKDSAIYMEKLKPTLLDAYIPYLPKEQLVNRDNVIIIDDKLEPKQVRGVVLKKPGELTISFRGTSSTDDIKSDLKVLPAAYEQTDSKVHAGFYNMHKEYIDQVTESVAKLMAQEPGSIKKITLTGHSLGGTLAVLAALHIKSIPNMPRVKIVTFGQPPIGDKAFANHVNHEFPGDQYLRVKQKGDPLNANVKLFGNGVTGKRRIKLVQAGKKVYVEGYGHSFQKHIKNDREQFVNSG